MTPASIRLSIRQDTGSGRYRFLCPTCLEPVEKPADRKIVALLVSAGVEPPEATGQMSSPEQLPSGEARDVPLGPAFTLDDLIDFHFLVQDDIQLDKGLLSG